MNFNRFDICEAYYLFHANFHISLCTHRDYNRPDRRSIQAILHRIRFRPSPLLSYESMSENAQAIFDSLVERYYKNFRAQAKEGWVGTRRRE